MFIDLVEQPLDVLWFPSAPECLQKGRTLVENNALDGFLIRGVGEFRYFVHNQQTVDKGRDNRQ